MQEYFSKVVDGVKPIISILATMIMFVMFPDPNKIYLYSAFALSIAMVCDVVTKCWAIAKKTGGWRKAFKTKKIFSGTFWEKTYIKLKAYLIIAILSGVAYRVTFLEQFGIVFGSFAYAMMFVREVDSNLENLEEIGADVGWFRIWNKKKMKQIEEKENIASPTTKRIENDENTTI